MSNERAYGADMIPEPIPDFAVVETTQPVPQSDTERYEYVNADVLRRDLHIRMDALVRQIRSLPPGSPNDVRGMCFAAACDLERAAERYLRVENTFRKSR